MSLKSLCFIYRFIDEPANAGYKIVGVHDQFRPWTPQQLAANGLITQKFHSRSMMETSIDTLAKKFQVASYSLLSLTEYNSMMEESHQLEDFRIKLQSREVSLISNNLEDKDLKLTQDRPPNGEKHQIQGFFSRLFGSDS